MDVVIEVEVRLVPFDVKASALPRLADCAHLRSFRAEYGSQARSGLLHTGKSVKWLTADVLTAPCWRRRGGRCSERSHRPISSPSRSSHTSLQPGHGGQPVAQAALAFAGDAT